MRKRPPESGLIYGKQAMLEVVQKAVEAVLSLFLIGLVGYVLDKKKWFCPETKAMLPQLVTLVTLPPYLCTNIMNTFNREQLTGMFYGLAVPAISIVISFVIGLIGARLLKVRPGRKGLFSVAYATSNTIYIGLPVNIALFGPEALPYVLLYFFANTSFFWTIGNYYLSLDGEASKPVKIISADTFKRLFSPPLIGFLVGVLLVMLNLRPPEFIMFAAESVGSLTMPLATMFIGISIASSRLTNLKPDRDVIGLLFGRFIICPGSVIALLYVFDIPAAMAKVFIIQASLPVIASAVLLASYHKSDEQYASAAVTLSTLLSLVIIPVYMVIITLLNLN